ncbi:MAG: HAD family phosphatase [Deltaproteobacteria bacterium]|nr:HAD family phosphatase [Deltaproteobacteria bacterium]
MIVKSVIFDFGRVISARKPLSLFDAYERDLGLEPGTINTVMFESRAWRETLLGRKSYDEFWQAIGPTMGLETPSAVLAFQLRYHRDEKVNEEVVEIIRKLYGRCKLAVLSNAPPGLGRWLAQWKILNCFDTVFCSGDEGLAKPDARVFQKVMERLAVKPGEALFVDDTQEHVEAARALGMHVLLFQDAALLEKELKRHLLL